MLCVVERQQLLSNLMPILEREITDAPNLRRALSCLDAALRHDVMPSVMAIEVAQHRPHTFNRCIDDGRAEDAL